MRKYKVYALDLRDCQTFYMYPTTNNINKWIENVETKRCEVLSYTEVT